jgi:galactose-1-phosphate uridylyltransferase
MENNPPGMPKEKLEMFLARLNKGINFRNVFQDMREGCYRPAGYSIDPRNGAEIIFSKSREKRPSIFDGKKPCAICEGDDNEILPFIMAQKLSSGAYAFVNENKYAFLNPDGNPTYPGRVPDNDDKTPLRGGNFLVWPTTDHMEIHELSYEDHAISFKLIGELEQKLLIEKFEEDFGFKSIQIIKNIGSLIPGAHGHGPYQVTCSNKFVKRIAEDINYLAREGKSFIQFLDEDITSAMQVRDYGTMKLATHRFTKRALEAIIYPKDMKVQSVGDLNDEQIRDLARVTSDVSYALSLLMPARGNPFDYSFAFHTGPIGTMYVEVFPCSQRPGGFERLGRYVYQGTPDQSAEMYRRFFNIFLKGSIKSRYSLDPNKEVLNYVAKEIIGPAMK